MEEEEGVLGLINVIMQPNPHIITYAIILNHRENTWPQKLERKRSTSAQFHMELYTASMPALYHSLSTWTNQYSFKLITSIVCDDHGKVGVWAYT